MQRRAGSAAGSSLDGRPVNPTPAQGSGVGGSWHPDPYGQAQWRWWDGQAWTPYVWPPAGPGPGPTWPGRSLGRPPAGSGSLASPWTRLAARLLDGLVLLPLLIPLMVGWMAFFFSRADDLFKTTSTGAQRPGAAEPTLDVRAILGLYAAMFAFVFVQLAVSITYEALMTRRYGRTLGKRWMKIRPLRCDGSLLSLGRCWARPAVYSAMSMVSLLGLLNQLWLFWDPIRQCLHDKVVDTIVVND